MHEFGCDVPYRSCMFISRSHPQYKASVSLGQMAFAGARTYHARKSRSRGSRQPYTRAALLPHAWLKHARICGEASRQGVGTFSVRAFGGWPACTEAKLMQAPAPFNVACTKCKREKEAVRQRIESAHLLHHAIPACLCRSNQTCSPDERGMPKGRIDN